MMQWEATYKITTPMFLAGAEQDKPPELRLPSFKGLLRFWFRAVALPKLGKWEEVQKLEKEIFGSTERQSSFLLGLDLAKPERMEDIDFRRKYGLIYLGHGLVDFRGELQRPYYKGSSVFTLRLLFKKKNISKDVEFFLPLTLKALGLFGGAGARSRRGFGSLSLLTLSLDGQRVWNAITNISELVIKQKELLNALELKTEDGKDLPEYTAFSGRTRIWIGKTGNKAIDLLNDIGLELLRYRSFGKEENGKHVLPSGEEAEQNFAADHDLIMQFCKTAEIEKHPARVVFGLPHNYFFSQSKESKDIVQIQPYGETGRRASPLFIHIHDLGKNGYAAVFTLFPAQFLPQKTEMVISVKQKNERKARYKKWLNYDENYINFHIIEKFMERPAFSQKVVVWP